MELPFAAQKNETDSDQLRPIWVIKLNWINNFEAGTGNGRPGNSEGPRFIKMDNMASEQTKSDPDDVVTFFRHTVDGCSCVPPPTQSVLFNAVLMGFLFSSNLIDWYTFYGSISWFLIPSTGAGQHNYQNIDNGQTRWLEWGRRNGKEELLFIPLVISVDIGVINRSILNWTRADWILSSRRRGSPF